MDRNRLPIHARRLRFVVLTFLGLSVVAFAVGALGFDLGPAVQVQTDAPGGSLAWAGVSLAPFLVALWKLSTMLARVTDGELFSPGVMTGFRGFAFWLMLSALASILVPIVAGAIDVVRTGSGHIPITLEARAILYLIAAAVLFLVARMLEEAARIDAELKEIV